MYLMAILKHHRSDEEVEFDHCLNERISQIACPTRDIVSTSALLIKNCNMESIGTFVSLRNTMIKQLRYQYTQGIFCLELAL